ncbi:ArsR family transcriptional regulator [Natronolimnobius sp. AArcel1]|uniref:DUF7344 domain-containing protein n=1 Tax=Natronolimnobius sp. AArcel1 TaxID=1679093 RepID=UPI0013EB5C9F|nr:ArsR family transcriptional regulator [Natronolimnobius sp. AArcel1]NGM68597.1 ArsR family transcriptional regulator [Natronolimnobius sp. AArcel1]
MSHCQPEERPLDEYFSTLASGYRRRLLVVLLTHNPHDDDDPQIPTDLETDSEERHTPKVEIVHTHLPKLEDAGFIKWDQEAHVVRKGPRFDELRPLLELLVTHVDELPTDYR